MKFAPNPGNNESRGWRREPTLTSIAHRVRRLRLTSLFTPSSRSLIRSRSCSAFTLAEVLAALVFMAILIPVALEGLSIASRAGEVAARKSEAGLVAEKILNETIVTTNWSEGVQNGAIRQGVRDFRYTLRNDPWDQDPNQSSMRLLSVEVKFAARGHDYSVRLSTLADTSPPVQPATTQ